MVGERIIQAIRFPVMQLDEFTSVVRDSKVLKNEEVAPAIKCITLKEKSTMKRRCGPQKSNHETLWYAQGFPSSAC